MNSAEQREIAEKSREQLAKSEMFDDPIVTKIEDAQPFYPAEEEHQEFYKKNPLRYQIQEAGGRSEFQKKYWK
ncbi:Peptide-methionine (S)-S-oxide reductase [Pediococcus pentosaceus]|uniref:peptide-methionine (S)-S-oxide reductase n=1 Tax=Pediococcus pentosaceus TaxID=1255 RepID=A0A1Y0VNQ3_PEDPE|nr:Peptide-methionine (S)-S-oxide reductase [Pediococcus pentosaceus]